MGNYTGSKHKLTVKITEKNVITKLIELMSNIDSDYEILAPIIIPRIIKNKKTLTTKIEALLNFDSPTDEEIEQDDQFADSTFLLNNSSYCSNFEYTIKENEKGGVTLVLTFET